MSQGISNITTSTKYSLSQPFLSKIRGSRLQFRHESPNTALSKKIERERGFGAVANYARENRREQKGESPCSVLPALSSEGVKARVEETPRNEFL